MKLNILKRRIRRYMLLLKFIKKTLLIIIEKQLFLAIRKKNKRKQKIEKLV